MNVALCTETLWAEKPFTELLRYKDIPDNVKGYEHIFLTSKKFGITLIKSNFEWYDLKNKIFKKGWTYDGTWKQVFNFKVESVWDKSPMRDPWLSVRKKYGKTGKILNPLELELICSDKDLTDKHFKELLPKTIIVNSSEELKAALHYMTTKKIVTKPAIGSGAKGVKIFFKKELVKIPRIKEKTLVQEFIESKKNLFKFPYEVFDLRVIVVKGKIVDSFYRVSKKGVFTSNISTGCKLVVVAPSKLSKKVVKFVDFIDSKFKKFPMRMYSVDILIDNDSKLWLLELNTKPGILFTSKQGLRRKNFEKAIFEMFL